MRVLVLDDQPVRHAMFARIFVGHDIVDAYSEEAALVALSSPNWPPFDVATLDHDLGMDAGNGLAVARFIAQMPIDRRPAQVLVHSANPVGSSAMLDTLIHSGVVARRVDPFSMKAR